MRLETESEDDACDEEQNRYLIGVQLSFLDLGVTVAWGHKVLLRSAFGSQIQCNHPSCEPCRR